MAIDVILGLQWGDEGKGKIVDYLSEQYDLVCRFQGGPNAGHTIKIADKKYVLHTVPSGIFRPNVINVIGNGVVIDPGTLLKELAKLDEANIPYRDRLLIANKAHLILPTHRYLDAASEASKGKEKIGSTLKGIGPTYMDKTGRNGLRIGDIYSPDFADKYKTLKEKHIQMLKLYPPIEFDLETAEKEWFAALEQVKELKNIDGEYYVNKALKAGKKILAEGAQGSMLDIDFGTYPFVTSSNTVTSGVCNGLGVAPHTIGEVIGITKAYCTRVGSGPFPSELHDETGALLGKHGMEFGATTGRPRRCGWIDIPQLKYTIMINGVTQICLTKLDVLNFFDTVNVVTEYTVNGVTSDEIPYDMCMDGISLTQKEFAGWGDTLSTVKNIDALPKNAADFVSFLENLLEVKITMVSIGPERDQLLLKD